MSLVFFGFVFFGMAVGLSTEHVWTLQLFLIDTSGFLSRLFISFEVFMYAFSLLLIGIGGSSYFVCKLKKSHCTTVYLVLLPFVMILLISIAIPIKMIYWTSEAEIN